MNRIHTYVDRAKTVATAMVLFIVASMDAMRKLPGSGQRYGVGDFVAQIFIALLGAISIVLFEQVVNWAIRKSRGLRVLIMGRQDIEGYWLETMRSQPTGEIIGFAVESINYTDEDFVIDGKQFDIHGRYTGSYWTIIHEYADNQSKLVFGSKHVGDAGPEKSGYSLVHYLRPNRQITGYVGYFTDTDMAGRIDITGQRLTAPDEVALASTILGTDLVPESSAVVHHLYRLKSRGLQQAIQSLTTEDTGQALTTIVDSSSRSPTVIHTTGDVVNRSNAVAGADEVSVGPVEVNLSESQKKKSSS